MIGIVTALHCEARPLIRHFQLKKEERFSPLEIFGAENIRLAISGIGKLRSAIAVTRLLTLPDKPRFRLLINLGICGANTKYAIGEPVLANQVIDAGSGRRYFPDMLARQNLTEATLRTFDKPVFEPASSAGQIELADMEAAGFFEAARRELEGHRIAVLKIVSDHFEKKPLNKTNIEKIIEANLPQIEGLIRRQYAALPPNGTIILPEEEGKLRRIAEQMRLTTTQFRQLADLFRSYKIRTGRSVEVLDPENQPPPTSKLDRRRRFETLKKRLVQS